jgi:multidrug efflux system outer membrane protein
LMDREILKISEENFAAQSEKFKFSELRYKTGLDSQTQLLTAQAAIETARITRDSYIKIVEQDKNALMALTGVFDEKSLPQNISLDDIKIAEDLLEFVPSEALLLRPDIRQAEHSLKSSNANIGAARAAFFPSITLSGTYGYGSRDLNTLLDSRTWTFTPQINLPIFTGGRNLANLDSANADKKIQIGNYEKVIQNAFREALDQFAQREAISKQLKSYDKIFAARNKFYNLSQSKHKVGSSSANELLDAKISMLAAKQSNITAKKEYIANLITLYKVLGGGSDVGDDEDDCK